jgi:hypothetical protein
MNPLVDEIQSVAHRYIKSNMVIIHIGYHKSASTYLQKRIFPQLTSKYLGLPRPILNAIEAGPSFQVEELTAWVSSRLGESEQESDAQQPVILSNEELSGPPEGGARFDPFEVADNLNRAYPDARILIVVRNQFDYLRSIYAFRVAIKGYETRSFSKFLAEEGQQGLFAKLEYDGLIAYYASLFGAANVLVLPLELLKGSPAQFNNLIADFCGGSLSEVPDKPTNVSTKKQVIVDFWIPVNVVFRKLLKLLSPFSRDNNPHYSPHRILRYSFYYFKRGVTWLFNKVYRHAKDLGFDEYPDYQGLYAIYADSNRRLQAFINVDLEVLGYPMKSTS